MTAEFEKQRLLLVNKFSSINFESNRELNDILTLMTELFHVPIGLITLMGEHRQFIKVKVGIDIESFDRENSFCKYLIGSNVLVISDTLLDERLKDHPLVTEGYKIRFYAGVPLITTSGYHLGSLCVLDHKPHEFSAKQEETLAILSRQVISILEFKMGITLLQEQKDRAEASERKLRAFFDSSVSSHMLIGKDLKVIDFNKNASFYVKDILRKQIKIGSNASDFVSEQFKNEFLCSFKRALFGRKINKDVLIGYTCKGEIWWNISFYPIKDEAGKVVSVSYNATDISERKMQSNAICTQNASLANIAYIHAHEYRRPVASIMGIMNIIKEDNYRAEKECLLMMEAAVNELDGKIKEVIKCSEKVLYEPAI